MLCSVHNHELDHKLADHPIVSRLDCDEKKIATKKAMNMVQLKNILAALI